MTSFPNLFDLACPEILARHRALLAPIISLISLHSNPATTIITCWFLQTYLKAAMHTDQRKQPTRKSALKFPVHTCIDILVSTLYPIFSLPATPGSPSMTSYLSRYHHPGLQPVSHCLFLVKKT